MSVVQPLVSVIVPVYNEAAGIEAFHISLQQVLDEHFKGQHELIYVDDGSRDDSLALLHSLASAQPTIRLLRLSRNFGKELATTAGIHLANGKAIITLDADGQHPVELLPDFVARWQNGARVVVGLRQANHKEGPLKHWGSVLFYRLFSRLSGLKLVAGATDYRLIDRSVQQQFIRLTERNRITRGLIDWLGYQPEYLPFTAHERAAGGASYSFQKLVKLAIDSAVSLSLSPLYITAYIGAVVLPLSSLLGLGMLVNYLLRDPLHLHATGGAYVMVVMLFLLGILLVSQGIIGLYLSHIHTETQNRPLYVIDDQQSMRLT